jgi:transposase
MMAFLCLLKISSFVSFRNIQRIFKDAYKIDVSTGYLSKAIIKVSKILEAAYNELVKALPKEKVLNIDETGHKENGDKSYLWIFRASRFVVFKIGTRSSYLLEKFLGKIFCGIIGCDCHTAYFHYVSKLGLGRVSLQLCWAHLIRDFRNCYDHKDYNVRQYGKRMLMLSKAMFLLYHQYNNTHHPWYYEQLKLIASRITQSALKAPLIGKASGIAKRFRKYPEYYFNFIDNPDVEPTNNLAENGIRPYVCLRNVSQGTRSSDGTKCLEIMMTAYNTCQIQKYSFFKFIKNSLTAYYSGQKLPSLLNLHEGWVIENNEDQDNDDSDNQKAA